MASIRERRNASGKITSFAIRVYRGRDENGKQYTPLITSLKVEPSWSEKTARKKAEALAISLENDFKQGKISDDKQSFKNYCEYVLSIKSKNKTIKSSTLERYYELTERIYPKIGIMKLKDIRPQHLNDFYAELSDTGICQSTAVCKKKLETVLSEKRLGIGADETLVNAVAAGKKLSLELLGKAAEVSPSTISLMTRGKSVQSDKANALARVLGYETDKLFTITTDIRPMAPKTVVEYHRLISSVLAQAEKEMLVPYNAAKKASPPKVIKKDPNYYQPDTICEIEAALDQESIKWRTIGYMHIYTGARRGEVLGIKWEDIDFTEHTVRICRNVLYNSKNGVYLDTPKTQKSNRYISLPNVIMDILASYKAWQDEEIKRLQGYYVDSGFLFTNEKGGLMNPGTLSTWLRRTEKKYNLPHLNAHAFRHSLASALISKHTDPVTVSNWLGHNNVSTTTDIYAHIINKVQRQACDILESVYSSEYPKEQSPQIDEKNKDCPTNS